MPIKSEIKMGLSGRSALTLYLHFVSTLCRLFRRCTLSLALSNAKAKAAEALQNGLFRPRPRPRPRSPVLPGLPVLSDLPVVGARGQASIARGRADVVRPPPPAAGVDAVSPPRLPPHLPRIIRLSRMIKIPLHLGRRGSCRHRPADLEACEVSSAGSASSPPKRVRRTRRLPCRVAEMDGGIRRYLLSPQA